MGIVDKITLRVYYLSDRELTLIVILSVTIFGVINNIVSKRTRIFGLFFWRIVNSILVGISVLIILFYTIIDRSSEGSYAMPFIRSVELIRERPELIREMVMNAFLFFPCGLSMPYAIEGKFRKPVFITIISALILTCTIELIQYLCNFGNCELSDIVMNTLGAAIGTVSYLVSSKLRR